MAVMTFGDWLKGKRGIPGEPGFISQEELARRIGVKRTRVGQLERLDRAPSYDVRARIHEALGSSDEELIEAGVFVVGLQRAEALHDEGYRILLPTPLEQRLQEGTASLDDVLSERDRVVLDVVMAGVERLTPEGLEELERLIADVRREMGLEDAEPSS